MGANCSHEKFEQLRDAIARQCAADEAYLNAHPIEKFIEYHENLIDQYSEYDIDSFDIDEFLEIRENVRIQRRDKRILYNELLNNVSLQLTKRELKELGLRDNEQWIKIYCKFFEK